MPRGAAAERAARRAFIGVAALLFAASAAATIVSGASMSAAARMRGGWAVSPAWPPMPGRTWLGASASFLGMWVVMMVAMMLPSLAPVLWRHLETACGAGATRVGRLAALVGVGYFMVWTLFGIAALALGAALAAAEARWPVLARALPIAVVLVAGALQFTAWKAHHLACSRRVPGDGRALLDAGTAWRAGLRLGLHCGSCCAGLMAILVVLGVMNLRVMAAITAAMTLERVAPAGGRAARAIGSVAVGAGVVMLALAAGIV